VATTREKLGGREEIFKRLGVDLYNPRNWAPPSAEDMLPKDKRMYTRFLKRIQDRFRTQGKKSKKRTVRVKQGFSLSEMFETWSSQDYEGFESILFKDLQGASDVSHLLSRWRINYDGKCCYWHIDGRVKRRDSLPFFHSARGFRGFIQGG
jgi:hypothetical protein